MSNEHYRLDASYRMTQDKLLFCVAQESLPGPIPLDGNRNLDDALSFKEMKRTLKKVLDGSTGLSKKALGPIHVYTEDEKNGPALYICTPESPIDACNYALVRMEIQKQGQRVILKACHSPRSIERSQIKPNFRRMYTQHFATCALAQIVSELYRLDFTGHFGVENYRDEIEAFSSRHGIINFLDFLENPETGRPIKDEESLKSRFVDMFTHFVQAEKEKKKNTYAIEKRGGKAIITHGSIDAKNKNVTDVFEPMYFNIKPYDPKESKEIEDPKKTPAAQIAQKQSGSRMSVRAGLSGTTKRQILKETKKNC